MAKQKKEKSGGMKGTGVLIIILIIISWLSIMALLIKCDVGGFGSGVLRPVLKDVPELPGIESAGGDGFFRMLLMKRLQRKMIIHMIPWKKHLPQLRC